MALLPPVCHQRETDFIANDCTIIAVHVTIKELELELENTLTNHEELHNGW